VNRLNRGNQVRPGREQPNPGRGRSGTNEVERGHVGQGPLESPILGFRGGPGVQTF